MSSTKKQKIPSTNRYSNRVARNQYERAPENAITRSSRGRIVVGESVDGLGNRNGPSEKSEHEKKERYEI